MFPYIRPFPGFGNRHEHLRWELIRAIADGHLKPADRLPTGKQLKAAYGFSPSVVLKATDYLKQHGLVEVVKRTKGTFVAQGATPVAQRLVRTRGGAQDAQRSGPDVEVAKPAGSYTRDEPIVRSRVAISLGAELCLRRPTEAELAAGQFFVDELVVDVDLPDGTTESHGVFHTRFKLPALPPGDQ
jgi:Bacterial regulatory proteins, gntR family